MNNYTRGNREAIDRVREIDIEASKNLASLVINLLGYIEYICYSNDYLIHIEDRQGPIIYTSYDEELVLLTELLAFKKLINVLENLDPEIIRRIRYEKILGREIEGPIDYPTTNYLIAAGLELVSYHKIIREIDSPEMQLLLIVLKYLEEFIKKMKKYSDIQDQVSKIFYNKVLENILEPYNRLFWIKSLLPGTMNIDRTRVNDIVGEVIKRGLTGFLELAMALKNYLRLRDYIEKIVLKRGREIYGFSRFYIDVDRLYEVYAYYLFLTSLVELLSDRGNRIELKMRDGGNRIRIRSNSYVYEVIHDREPGRSIFKNYPIGIEAGRPDISIKLMERDSETILFTGDAKFRTENVNREARIILGYMKEYNVRYGALIYEPIKAGKEQEEPIKIFKIKGEDSILYVIRLNVTKISDNNVYREHVKGIKTTLDELLTI